MKLFSPKAYGPGPDIAYFLVLLCVWGAVGWLAWQIPHKAASVLCGLLGAIAAHRWLDKPMSRWLGKIGLEN